MTHTVHKTPLIILKEALKVALQLDLDDFHLVSSQRGEYTSDFAGIHLESAFQAIYDIRSGDFHGHEALLRPKLGKIKEVTPDFAFTYADKSDKLIKLDRVSRTLHVLNYSEIFKENGLLFLNVHPSLLLGVSEHGKVFERILHSNLISTDRVVIEIKDFDTFKLDADLINYESKLEKAINNYQDRGYKIAIDNFGNPYSTVSRLWKFKPDYVKFDLNLIKDAVHDVRTHHALLGLVNLVKSLGAKPIMTGVETQQHLHSAIETGVELIQGYFLAKPSAAKSLKSSTLFNQPLEHKHAY